MSDGTLTLKRIDGIYDIQPIIEPALNAIERTILIILILTISLSVVYFIWRYFFSKKAVSKRKISKLQSMLIEKSINSHDAIYQLCKIMRQGLDIKQLNDHSPFPEKLINNKIDWEEYINKLSTLRYKNKQISFNELSEIFNESLIWLKRWP